MTKRPAALCLVTLLFVSVGCTRQPPVTHSPDSEEYVTVPGSVGFDIAPPENRDGSLRLKATHTSRGKTARFIVEFDRAKPLSAKDAGDFPMTTGVGRLVAEPDSDASSLLANLQTALEAKALPTKVQRVKSLPFTFVNLGDKLSHSSGGGFNEQPPGNWTAIKIFIGEGEEESEVFVNFNPVIRKGEFSIKDPEYGDRVLAELARVL